MNYKIFLLLNMLSLCHTRYVVQPKFYAKDSAIIVDTNKEVPMSLMQPQSEDLRFRYHPIQPYPVYHILPPLKSTKSQTTSPPSPIGPDLQTELIQIAREKLGVKTLDEIPTISELGELLGTTSESDTMKYIRHLIKTDQGIALIKAYIETSDYTDNTGSTTKSPSKLKEDRTVVSPINQRGTSGFFERIAQYLNIYGFTRNPESNNVKSQVSQPLSLPPLENKPNSLQGKHIKEIQHQGAWKPVPASSDYASQHKPLLMRRPLPYHYPVPMKPSNMFSNMTQLYSPHTQLAKIINIAPKKLEDILQGNPKFAELAGRVNRYMVSTEHVSQIDKQILRAFEKAIAQDEDLKKLLNATDTLK